MKKFYRMILFLMLLLVLTLTITAPAFAVDDEVIVDTATVSLSIDWGAVLSKLLVGVVGALGTLIAALVAYITKKYILPNLPTLIQWLKDKNMMSIVKTLVEAAEAQLGRYTGDEKWEKVCEWLEARGFTITDEVEQAILAAWLELNNTMIELGLKDADEELDEVVEIVGEELETVEDEDVDEGIELVEEEVEIVDDTISDTIE